MNSWSQWRIWDLQVQTILDDGYVSISNYIEDLERDYPVQFQTLVSRMWNKENIIKYDDRGYFYTWSWSSDSEELRTNNYARLFVHFIDIFNPQAWAVCVTDHNYSHNCLIDCLVKSSKDARVKVIPWVEINVQWVHMLVLFWTKTPYRQPTYAEWIKMFLAKINVHAAKTGWVLTVSDKSYADVIREVETCDGILIYPHCNSNNWLFQERWKTDRTHLANQFNHKNPVLLQAQKKSMAASTVEYIKSKPSDFRAKYWMTLGSDARCLKDILKPDEQGNYCWIKSDVTFEGLKRVMNEPDERIFLWDRPEIFKRVELDRTHFISHLKIKQAVGYSWQYWEWFKDITIPFNPWLTAIIWNKWSGKSAIADIIWLVWNSHKSEQKFSFLNRDRFKKKWLAKNFDASIKWESWDVTSKNLGDDVDDNAPERVRYLPQRYFEDLTNEQDASIFQRTLEDVVFWYLPDHEKLWFTSFGDLISFQKGFLDKRINALRADLSTLNAKIAALENKAEPSYRTGLIKQRDEILLQIWDQDKQIELHKKNNGELSEHKATKEKVVSVGTQKIDELERESASLNAVILTKKQEYSSLRQRKTGLQNLIKSIDILKDQIQAFKLSQAPDFKLFWFNIEEIIGFTCDLSKIELELTKIDPLIQNCWLEICEPDEIANFTPHDHEAQVALLKINLPNQMKILQNKILDIRKWLTEHEQKIHEFEKTIKTFALKKQELEWSAELPGTLKYYLASMEYLDEDLPSELHRSHQARVDISRNIYREYAKLLELYKGIKWYVDNKITEFPSGDDDQIHIDVGVILSRDFAKDFTTFILRNKKWSFCWNDNAETQLKGVIQEINPDDESDIQVMLAHILEYLKVDQRAEIREEDRSRNISEQVTDVSKFYDYLFGLEYLEIKYDLWVWKKKLSELSPWERGTLLLIFYLMIDKETLPLIIDQPEDNLDNQSVYNKLSKFIREAKTRRQIIIVTHNPNLAIGADAENIIQVRIDKSDNRNEFSSNSGAIEDPRMNDAIVTVLEWTMPAFQGRDRSYIK